MNNHFEQTRQINRRGQFIKWVLTPLILVSFFYAVYYWLEMNKPEPEQRPNRVKKIRVFTYTAENQKIQLKGHSQGQVLPVNMVELKPQVSGPVVYVSPNLVNGGQFKKGELLIEIEPSDYELAVIQKQARVAQASQQLAQTEAEAEAAVLELKSLGRTSVTKLALREPQLKQAKANLKSAEAELAIAKLSLQRTRIYAPFDGRVEKETVSEYQYVNRGNNLASIFSTELMEVRLPLSIEQLSQIQLPAGYYQSYEKSPFTVKLYGQTIEGQTSWPAKIVRTEAVVDNKTRSLFAVAQVKNPYQSNTAPLLSGSFVAAEISGRWIDAGSELPKTALRNNGELWIVGKKNELEIVPANIVQRTPDSIIVTGLKNKTRVITSALAMATNGLKVIPIEQKSTLEVSQKAVKKPMENTSEEVEEDAS
ncbi:efflux RND transporter periplasmic adaptor subunit [Gayadomonas joobiniege]|uniref:efflux RND transporter periplasmic adaptor subunit n=1 Tax=Gayadomonas joobiniege TaxID=1234606 RepID=UPI00036D4152|nr:efflux RND transporter periplasmic adaptor subunit [Gayadomonas joobiniege]